MHPTYKKMLKGLEAKAEKSKRKKKDREDWFLYILRCADGSFYTGITKDILKRLQMHQKGKASRYTRTHGPVELIYQETCGDHTRALIRECEVKEFSRKKKEELVSRSPIVSENG